VVSPALTARLLVVLVLAGFAVSPALAEDVEKKFRLGFAIGGWNADDELESDSANVLVLVDESFVTEQLFFDPRNDSAVFGELSIQSGPIGTFYAQYAVNKIFIVEASVGYGKYDVGDIEVQAQFDKVDVPDTQPFNFSFFRVQVGELDRIPIQFTGMARFRPRASFNPYVGAGIGYAFIGFEPSQEFNDLSVNMDASLGEQSRLTGSFNAAPSFFTSGTPGAIEGATIDASDTFEWHLAGGAELSFRRNWSAFFDIRLTFASREFTVGFNGGQYLGIPVPNLTDFSDAPAASSVYGPVQVFTGGLLDGGSIQPRETADPDTDCDVTPVDCVFVVGEFDGETDTGAYYAQGGSVDFDGIALQFGVRYTF
jgi:hypothetical protein